MGDISRLMAAVNVVLLIPLVLAFMPRHAAHASTVTQQPTQFDISMRKTMELPEELRRQHVDRVLEAVRVAEREFEGGGGGSRRSERVLADTGMKLGLSAPPLSSGPSMATVKKSSRGGAMALMKAVSMQPVVAFISASAADFTAYASCDTINIYNGVCTTDVNHAVVVVGFNYTGPDLKGSYWIIKNSWYATWGDRGYMYLAMMPDVRGKCGTLSTPAMYPVYFPSGQQPARFASYKRGKWRINKVDDLSSSLYSSTLSTTTTTTTTTTISTTTQMPGALPGGGPAGLHLLLFLFLRLHCQPSYLFLPCNPPPLIQCQAPYLVVGQQVCIDSPILTTMQRSPNISYSIYTVRANDTLSTISSLFLPRCTLLSVTPAAIAAQNFIANLSAPLPVGTNLIIPCIGGIGMIDGGCALSLTVCGADFVSYPSYCHAAVNYALPIFQNSPCDSCSGPRTQSNACPFTPLHAFKFFNRLSETRHSLPRPVFLQPCASFLPS
ncbi:unnamed protein product [Closterium sp. Naga37s-1]|nr:unnamed protein product [Closterium sp. Naga37s-1]